MKESLELYYDEEGDLLEISAGTCTDGFFRNLGKGIFERVDGKSGQVTGILIMGFTKKAKHLKPIALSLPTEVVLDSHSFSMERTLQFYYDEEGDFLELSFGQPTKCSADEIEPGLFVRKDEQTHEIKSISILSFKKRMKLIEHRTLELPL